MPPVTATKYVTTATWDDAPHLSAEAKQQLWDSIPPFQRDARSKGVPQLGAGAIYPVQEDKIVCEPFEIPAYWPSVYAMDVGWSKTAALWAARDRKSDTLYFWSEYYEGHAEPATHVEGIKSRGDWINGVIDPASNGRSQKDGSKLYEQYIRSGLRLTLADNTVEAGIYMVYQRMVSGRLKIFSTLRNMLSELRLYRRDEHGKIVKQDDHLMDCMRYLVVSGVDLATVYAESGRNYLDEARAELINMQRNIF